MAEGSTGERLLWSAWTALVLCVAPLRAESRRALPTFGAGVEVVNLDLAVTDTRDRPVSNLTGSDLAVFEDGVPQELCIFTQERLPLSLSILIDGSASMGPRIAVAQAAALRLIRALGL